MRDERIRIRPAREQDRPGVLALAPRLAVGLAPWRDRAAAAAAGNSWLEDSLAAAGRGEGIVLVAEVAGEVAGVITVRTTRHFTGERDGYIGELAVNESSARHGIGRAFIEAARSWAQDQGLANLTLHTGAFNANARAFYAALGFGEEEVRLTLNLLPDTQASRKAKGTRPPAQPHPTRDSVAGIRIGNSISLDSVLADDDLILVIVFEY